jgi:threonine dehydrogenase-like Zn-dependent dehydrogenase
VAVLSSHAYAAYDLAPAEAVVPLPAALDGVPFPGEVLGCTMNIFRRSDIHPGQTVAIIGIGFLGALLTGLASQAEAHVLAISRRAFALEMAQHFGATATLRLDDPRQVIEQVMSFTEGTGCERVIEAVGQQETLDLAGELTRVRGRLIIAGYHQDGLRQVNMQLWNWRGLDVINAHERDPAAAVQGMREAVAAIESGLIDPPLLITHRYPLDRLGDALNATRDRPGNFVKAVVVP